VYQKHGAYYYVDLDISTGKSTWIRLGATVDEALRKHADLLFQKGIGAQRSKEPTIANLLDAYIAAKESESERYARGIVRPKGVLRTSTVKDYQKAIRFLIASIGHLPLRQLDKDLVFEFQTQGKAKGHGATQLDRRLATLSAAISWGQQMIQWRRCLPENNPVLGFKRLGGGRRHVYPNHDVLRRVIEDPMLPSPVRLHIQMLLLTGQRQQDVLDMRFDQIRTGPRGVRYLEITRKKTAGAPLRLPIGRDLGALIEASRTDGTNSAYIVHTESGARMTYANVQSQWKLYRKLWRERQESTDLKRIDFTLHDLRAKVATDMLNAGAEPREVQALLGHKSLATTEIYIRQAKERFSKAIEMDGGVVLQLAPPKSERDVKRKGRRGQG
jgi:integrase